MLLSESLGVSSAKLWKFGVFDSYLGIDSLLHVDPARLRSTRVPELRGSYQRFHDYFAKILDLIAAAQPGDALERQFIKLLIFPEISEAALGYSQSSNSGRGVSNDVAQRLYKTAKAIIDAGIKNPSIFEVAVLFEDKFGPDLISDMTVFLLLEELSKFNVRVAGKLGLKTLTKSIQGKQATFVFAEGDKKAVLLIPHSILADLPLATSWSEIDSVCAYNDSLRRRINKMIQRTWRDRARQFTKPELKAALLSHPDLLRELLSNYAKAKAEPYDFDSDPRGFIIWHDASRKAAKENPLSLQPANTTQDVHAIVLQICQNFKHLIEQKGLDELLFDDGGRAKPEKASQLLFFGVADAHCAANNLDLSREPETGRGPADFKVSKGYHERVIVEVKLSSNGKYLDGLLAQLPTYLHAEKAAYGVLLLLKIGEHDQKIKRITAVHAKLKKAGTPVPDLVVVDAMEKASASKLRWGDADPFETGELFPDEYSTRKIRPKK